MTFPLCEAIVAAYKGSIHTILTSGTIMVLITAVIGLLFGNPTIEQIVRTFLALWITFFVRIVAQDLRLAGGLASF